MKSEIILQMEQNNLKKKKEEENINLSLLSLCVVRGINHVIIGFGRTHSLINERCKETTSTHQTAPPGAGRVGKTLKAVKGNWMSDDSELLQTGSMWRGERGSDWECEQTGRWRGRGWFNDKVRMRVWREDSAGDESEDEGYPGGRRRKVTVCKSL